MKNVARYEYESKCVTELIKRNILVIKNWWLFVMKYREMANWKKFRWNCHIVNELIFFNFDDIEFAKVVTLMIN